MNHKVGLVGFGQMGRNHARVLSKISEIDLIRVYDTNLDKVNKSEYPVASSLEEISNLSETIVIASSSETHFDLIQYFSEQKKNILVEKPISLKINEIESIYNISEKYNNYIKVGLLEKYNPTINFISKQNLTNFLHINIERLSPVNQTNRNSDNVLLDLTIHDFCILKMITRKKLDEIKFDFYFNKSHPSDHVNIIGHTESFSVSITTSKIYQEKKRSVEVLTQNSLYKANLLKNSVEISSLNDLSLYKNKDSYGHIEEIKTSYPVIEYTEPLLAQMKSFLKEVKFKNFKENRETLNQDLQLHKFLIDLIQN